MIKLLVLAAVLLLAGLPASATVAETAAVVAQGATTGFLAAEHPHDTYWGVPASDKQLTDIGLTICAHHRRGLSDRAVLQAMMGGPEMLPPAGSEGERMGLQRVRNAVRYLCP